MKTWQGQSEETESPAGTPWTHRGPSQAVPQLLESQHPSGLIPPGQPILPLSSFPPTLCPSLPCCVPWKADPCGVLLCYLNRLLVGFGQWEASVRDPKAGGRGGALFLPHPLVSESVLDGQPVLQEGSLRGLVSPSFSLCDSLPLPLGALGPLFSFLNSARRLVSGPSATFSSVTLSEWWSFTCWDPDTHTSIARTLSWPCCWISPQVSEVFSRPSSKPS